MNSAHTRDSEGAHRTHDCVSLSPLTMRLPSLNSESSPDLNHHISYIQGRSAPTTPSIFDPQPRSRSYTHLAAARPPRSINSISAGNYLRTSSTKKDQKSHTSSRSDTIDADWFLRASIAMSSSARESKGQTWLVSRASSTSLSRFPTEEDREIKSYNLTRENNSKLSSRKGSIAEDDEISPMSTSRSSGVSRSGSQIGSRYSSRIHSRKGSSVQSLTPFPAADFDGYFDYKIPAYDEKFVEPDFVNIEEDTYLDQKQEEAIIRELSRSSSRGYGGWIGKMLGWSLLTIGKNEENDDDDETETEIGDGKFDLVDNPESPKDVDDVTDSLTVEIPPPPKDGEVNLWQDAAWLLSIAVQALL